MSFYARYVPRATQPTTNQSQDSKSPSQKRKRESEPRPKNKRPKSSASDGQPARQQLGDGSSNSQTKVPEESTTSASNLDKPSTTLDSGTILKKYKVTTTAGRKHDEVTVHRRGQAELKSHGELDLAVNSEDHSTELKKKKKKDKKDKKHEAARDEQEPVSGDEQTGKHVNVLSKFRKAKEEKQTAPLLAQLSSEDVIQPEVHGLGPIPQP